MSSEIVHPKQTFGSSLRFTPYVWAKIVHLRDKGKTEVAGYCITGTDDPLLVTDFILVKQKCTIATFDLDTEDVAEYMDTMMDKGLMPWQYANILLHTHPPGCSPNPSLVDENNFVSAFSHPDWAIMVIVASDGSAYCRLKINVGPGSVSILDTVVEYGTIFSGATPTLWDEEYDKNVFTNERFRVTGKEGMTNAKHIPDDNDPLWAQSPGFADDMVDIWWDEDGEVVYGDESNVQYYYNPNTRKWRADDGYELRDISEPEGPVSSRIKMWAITNDKTRPDILEEDDGEEMGVQNGFADNKTRS